MSNDLIKPDYVQKYSFFRPVFFKYTFCNYDLSCNSCNVWNQLKRLEMIEKFKWFKINLWNSKKILNTKKANIDQTKPDEGWPAVQAGGGGGADGRFADKLEYRPW